MMGKSGSTALLAAALAATALALASAVAQQPAPPAAEHAGRFVLRPTEGGFVRMDTETGLVSFCRQRDGNLVCQMSADDRAALQGEIERLTTENRRLAGEVRRLEDMVVDPKGPPGKQAGRGRSLPSEEEVDQALDYFEKLYRKFKDRMERLERGDKKGERL